MTQNSKKQITYFVSFCVGVRHDRTRKGTKLSPGIGFRMLWGRHSLYQPSQLLQLAGQGSNKPSNLFVDGLLCQLLNLRIFFVDIFRWTSVRDFLSTTVMAHFAFVWRLIAFSVSKFSVVGAKKHTSFKTWILFRYFVIWVILQKQWGFSEFYNTIDGKQWILNIWKLVWFKLLAISQHVVIQASASRVSDCAQILSLLGGFVSSRDRW